MKKLLPMILLLSLVLTSCNFPLGQPTPDMNVVATKVAATFSAAETQMAIVEATDAPLDTDGAATPTLTSEPTQTETATATATATATSTPPAGDPAVTLGSPDFDDTFTSATSFGLSEPYEDSAIRIEVKNGAMVFTSLQAKGGMRWRLTSRNPQNLYLEGTFTTVNCSGTDQYGLVARAPTYSDGIGYYYGVTCNGQYYLLRWDNEDQNSIVNLTSDTHILAGTGQTNRLGLLIDGKTIRLYANGNLLKELEDDGITAKGYIGAFASARDEPNFTVKLEEIKLWNLP